MAPTAHEAALGALLGACVGDAAGVTLEFTSSDLMKPAAASSTLLAKYLALFGALCSHDMVSAIGIAAGRPLGKKHTHVNTWHAPCRWTMRSHCRGAESLESVQGRYARSISQAAGIAVLGCAICISK